MRLILIALFSTAAFALSLDEAVSLSLQNHPAVFQAEQSAFEATVRRGAADSAFWPTLSASLTQHDRENATNGAAQTTAVKATFNLFNGLGDLAASRAARWNETSARHQLEGVRADVALEAKEVFFGYLKAKDTLTAAEESLRLAQKQVFDAEAFYAQGLIAAHEQLGIQVEAAHSEQKALKAASDLKVARLTLESTMGVPLPSEPKPIAAQAVLPIEPANLNALMQERRSEIKSLQSLIEAQKQQKRKASADLLPTANLAFSQEQYEYDSGFSGLEEQTVATLTLNWSLFSGFKTLREREAAHYGQRILESRLSDLKRQLTLQLQSTYERYELASRGFLVVEAALGLAQEHYRIIKNRFDAQLSGATDLIDAEAALSRAREQYNLYYYDKLLALAELERVTQSPLMIQ